jgi:integrase
LKEAKGRSEASIDAVAKALNRFETYTRFRDFKAFHIEQAKGFKAHLAEQMNLRTGKRLSAATLYSTLGALKAFFQWLAGQPGYKSRTSYADAEYFNLSEKEARVATAHRDKDAPTIEQIRHVLTSMPVQTDIEKRDQALIAFTLLIGARDGAIASFKLKHIDVAAGKIAQDERVVKTKRSKMFITCFFPVGEDIRAIVADWVTFFQKEKLWGNDDPVFPATEVRAGPDQRFEAVGLARKHWSNATAIRKIFRDAFARSGLPYFNPHSFRNTLLQLAFELRLGREEFKVWSQNLGHESILATFRATEKFPPIDRPRSCAGWRSPNRPATALTRSHNSLSKKPLSGNNPATPPLRDPVNFPSCELGDSPSSLSIGFGAAERLS